jgi:transposase
MLKFLCAALIALSLTGGGRVDAQTAPDPDTIAAAKELMSTLRTADRFKQIVPTIVQSMKPAILSGRPQMEKDFGMPFQHLLADKGYDANWLRARVAEMGAEAVIPSTRSRSQAIRERNLVERFFNKIKHYRRIATRYEKTVVSFAATLFLVGAMIWLR